MIGSVTINGIIGSGLCIMLLYSSGSRETLLATPIGFPFMQIFLNATRSPGGATALSVIINVIAIAVTVAGTTSTSRTLWLLLVTRRLSSADISLWLTGHLRYLSVLSS
ncbi:hypothetical protein ACN47E_005926 [Coniothyrium glycines]